MSYDRPPPYFPSHPEGPSAPGFAAVLSSQPAAFPGLPYQTIAQTCTAGGDQSYYQGPPCWTQPGYQVYHSGPPHQGEHPKQTGSSKNWLTVKCNLWGPRPVCRGFWGSPRCRGHDFLRIKTFRRDLPHIETTLMKDSHPAFFFCSCNVSDQPAAVRSSYSVP
ncbi:uncharacterized protein LOC115019212 isoform X1 [Cottoperca gobio]|uniref:Cysteine-rich and transmembrane domain-containing protein 1 isoform X1 n=1 Tax=Cottoperca gobio TaxID=56716 RepID=A0A6J2R5A4_COTGO|nr:cysteine-rich and transmembrane domain-containing protein 1 isoform X1 [Cottoperca gobio]XP_029304511.1 cysteine-rich and transmembrane domain-containing protein 1 isoform X1 [Cottoperca gobio]